eukprot:1499389-Pleurochrysis_carterae.AAC.6
MRLFSTRSLMFSWVCDRRLSDPISLSLSWEHQVVVQALAEEVDHGRPRRKVLAESIRRHGALLHAPTDKGRRGIVSRPEILVMIGRGRMKIPLGRAG